jgi:3D (Asp-Asp-Asp) domain-containing protein
MKRIIVFIGAILFLVPPVFAREQPVLARITVYWASGGAGSDHWTRQHIAASGARLRAGHCAVDPRRIPYGSKVILPDGALIAADTGSAVRSRKAARRLGRTPLERNAIVIDRFFETKREALSWAQRNPYFMFVRISPPDMRSGSSFTQPQLATQSVKIVTPPAPTAPRRTIEQRPARRPGWMP